MSGRRSAPATGAHESVSFILAASTARPCHCNAVTKILSDPDGSNHLLTASRDSTIRYWSLGDSEATNQYVLMEHSHWVNDAVIVPSYRKVISCSSDKLIKVWDLPNVRDVKDLQPEDRTPTPTPSSRLHPPHTHQDSHNNGAAPTVPYSTFFPPSPPARPLGGLPRASPLAVPPCLPAIGTMAFHRDYVQALGYAYDVNLLASVGLDGKVCLADVTVAVPSFTIPPLPLDPTPSTPLGGLYPTTPSSLPARTPQSASQRVPKESAVRRVSEGPGRIHARPGDDGPAVISPSHDDVVGRRAAAGGGGVVGVGVGVGVGGGSSSSSACSSKRHTLGRFSSSGMYIPDSEVWKHSIWCLAINRRGSVLVCGTQAANLVGWDLRAGQVSFKLKGHTDNVRQVLLSEDSTLAVTGGSDRLLKVWDLRTKKVLHTITSHTDSIWALWGKLHSHPWIYSGGRDGRLFAHHMSKRESHLIGLHDSPILTVTGPSMPPDGTSTNSTSTNSTSTSSSSSRVGAVWCSTMDSSVHRWPHVPSSPVVVPFNPRQASANNLQTYDYDEAEVQQQLKPSYSIGGVPRLVCQRVLHNQRLILTRDLDKRVALWDVMQGAKINEFGQEEDFDKKYEELDSMVSVPQWFSADVALGALRIELDERRAFCAEVYASDLGLGSADVELKLNLGQRALCHLFARWSRSTGIRTEATTADGITHGGISPSKFYNAARQSGTPAAGGVTVADGGSNAPDLTILALSGETPPVADERGSSGHGQGGREGIARKHSGDGRLGHSIKPPLVKYVGLYDGGESEKRLPPWVFDCVWKGHTPPPPPSLVYFTLRPREGSQLPALQTTHKLSAPAIVRLRKVRTYVVERLRNDLTKLQQQGDKGAGGAAKRGGPSEREERRASTGPLEELVRLACKGRILSADMNLATVKDFICKSRTDVEITYHSVFDADETSGSMTPSFLPLQRKPAGEPRGKADPPQV